MKSFKLFISTIVLLNLVMNSSYSMTIKTKEQRFNERLQNEVDHWRNKLKLPALALSLSLPGEKTIRTYLSGNIDKKSNRKLLPSTLFQTGSITKPFTAAIILQLESEGKLSIHQTIADTVKQYGDWLPTKAYKRWKMVTIKQLLNMTSGISNYTENQTYNKAIVKNQPKHHSIDEIISVALSKPDYFTPGDGWHYSTTNYILLGLLIEKVTGHSVTDEMNQRFLGASNYNLLNTYYLPGPYPQSLLNRMARGFDKKGVDVTEVNMSFAGSAGAMVATTQDTIKWMMFLMNGQVLKPKQMKQFLTTASMKTGKDSKDVKESGFSLGLFRKYYPKNIRGGLNWEYLGGTFGYLAYVSWIPDSDMYISLATSVGMGYQAKGKYADGEKAISIHIPNSIYKLIAKYKK